MEEKCNGCSEVLALCICGAAGVLSGYGGQELYPSSGEEEKAEGETQMTEREEETQVK